MIRIATYAHRYKRPPGKRKAVALEVPAVITAASKRRRVSNQGHRCLNAAFVPCRPARPWAPDCAEGRLAGCRQPKICCRSSTMCEQPATHRMLSAGAAASRAACGMGMAGWISVGLGGWLVAGFWMAHTFGVAAKDDPVAPCHEPEVRLRLGERAPHAAPSKPG